MLSLLALCLLAIKAVQSQWAIAFGRARCMLVAGLLIAPMMMSLLINQFGEPDWNITFDITWPKGVYRNGAWLLSYLPTHVVADQHWLARMALVEGGGWMMLFIVVWKRRPERKA